MASLYRRGRVWYCKYRDPESGAWRYVSTGERRRDAALPILAALEARLRDVPVQIEGDTPWEPLLRAWETWAVVNRAAATRYLMRWAVEPFEGVHVVAPSLPTSWSMDTPRLLAMEMV